MTSTAVIHHNWLYRRIALPILALLRMGASPEKLAWSLAIGAVVGINPIVGSTTLLALALAAILRLNFAASQIGNHVVYPIQILLVLPWINLGTSFFHTGPVPLAPKALFAAARSAPVALIRQLWLWEFHALLMWLLFGLLAAPAIAFALTPLLRKLLYRVQRHEYPLIQRA